MHVVTSVVASAALLCAVGAGWWWQRARPDSPGARRRRLALGVAGGGYLLGTLWLLLEASRAVVALPWATVLGLAQRSQLLFACAWLLALGWIVHADTPAAQARDPRRRGGERPGQVTTPGEGG